MRDRAQDSERSSSAADIALPSHAPGRSSLSEDLPAEDGGGAHGGSLFRGRPWAHDDAPIDFSSLAESNEQVSDPEAMGAPGEIPLGDMPAPAVDPADAPHAATQGEHEGEEGEHEDPTQTAEQGFRDPGVDLPHRAELEQSFGMSFAGVKVHTGPQARRANQALGAHAYAVGNRIAFATPNPSKDLVAHELTHVVQHAQGPEEQRPDGGVALAGEGEAETVEQAVAAGKPAHGAMSASTHAHGANKGGFAGATQKRAPNLKANPKFATGMTMAWPGLSRSTFEKGQAYNLWNVDDLKIPIGAVPGLSILVSPSLQVQANAGVGKGKTVRASFGVRGDLGLGLSYGVSKILDIYTTGNAGASGGFQYEKSKKPKHWKFWGGLAFDASWNVGMKVGGVLDTKLQLGSLDIGRLTGLEWENGSFHRNRMGWAWSSQIKSFFGKVKNAINNAKKVLELPAKAAKKAWGELRKTPHAIFGAASAFKKILDKIPDITPWDGLAPW